MPRCPLQLLFFYFFYVSPLLHHVEHKRGGLTYGEIGEIRRDMLHLGGPAQPPVLAPVGHKTLSHVPNRCGHTVSEVRHRVLWGNRFFPLVPGT